MIKAITFKEVAIICPTLNKENKIQNLLNSISLQKINLGKIIIANSGFSSNQVIKKYEKTLDIIELNCMHSGQVLQRNEAYSILDKNIKLIINIDDDIILKKNALKNLLNCWNYETNNSKKKLVGMSFNILGDRILKNSFLRRYFFMDTYPLGKVSISGYAAPLGPISSNLKSEWLIGGCTAWSRNFIDKNPHPLNFSLRWAVCEDLIFSFPFREKYNLMVCSTAEAIHNEGYSEENFKTSSFKGYFGVLMRFYFITLNKNLSKSAFYWMTLFLLISYFCIGLIGSKRYIGNSFGVLKGIIVCVFFNFQEGKLKKFIEKNF